MAGAAIDTASGPMSRAPSGDHPAGSGARRPWPLTTVMVTCGAPPSTPAGTASACAPLVSVPPETPEIASAGPAGVSRASSGATAWPAGSVTSRHTTV